MLWKLLLGKTGKNSFGRLLLFMGLGSCFLYAALFILGAIALITAII
ncbi:MAG: hypothetical protein V1661_02425 [bacterium]